MLTCTVNLPDQDHNMQVFLTYLTIKIIFHVSCHRTIFLRTHTEKHWPRSRQQTCIREGLMHMVSTYRYQSKQRQLTPGTKAIILGV